MPGTTGVLLLDKPVGPTSREVLDGLERKLCLGPLGHAGTLDPLASGLLVVLAGRARRLQEFFLDRTKTYVARVRFGETTPTLDGEGEKTPTVAPAPLDAGAIRALLARFEGEILQTPPVFSAMRVRGRRAHKLARKGREVVLEPRPVRIDRIGVRAAGGLDWVLEVTCGAGVYIRSLARDLGLARGSGAWLAELRRTRSGGLRVEDAVPPAEADLVDLMPLSSVLGSEPRMDATPEEARLLFNGNVIPWSAPGLAPRFAWFSNRPCFRLISPAPGFLRSDLLVEDPGLASARPQ